MYNNDDDDSDEECDYFLKPANEYNITDKVKQANEELFSTILPYPSSKQERKVSFRANLEDIEVIEIELYSKDDENAEKPEIDNQEILEIIKIEDDLNGNVETKEKSSFSEGDDDDDENEEIEEVCDEIIEFNLQETHSEAMKEKPLIPISNTSPPRPTEIDDLLRIPKDELLQKHSKKFDKNKKSQKNGKKLFQTSSSPRSNMTTATTNTSSRYNSTTKSNNNNNNNKGTRIKYDIKNLKFNYKTCCEYKMEKIEKLPKYCGFFSEYGLSKEQWEKRQQRMEKGLEISYKKQLKNYEDNVKKREDNEKAFSDWLKKKLKCPINKTKNMFDFKKCNRRKLSNKAIKCDEGNE